jgi:hypothetical protein
VAAESRPPINRHDKFWSGAVIMAKSGFIVIARDAVPLALGAAARL